MPNYPGQTDQVLRIQLPSAMVSARFLENRFPANSEITFEVMTVYVGDTAPIEIDFVDAAGAVLYTHKGSVHSNWHRGKIPARALNPKPGPKLRVQMKVRLPKHGLTLTSDWAQVDAPMAIQDVVIQNSSGATPEKIHIGDELKLSASILGESELLTCALSLEVTYSDKRVLVWQSFEAEVIGGKAQIDCQITRLHDEAKFLSEHKTKPMASTYAAPKMQLRATCMGLSALSPEIPLLSQTQIVLPMRAKARLETPTGEVQTIDLSPDQPFQVPEDQVGVFRLLDLEPVDEQGQSLANQVIPGHPEAGASTFGNASDDGSEDDAPLPLPPMTPAT